jgi:hypothetical protein
LEEDGGSDGRMRCQTNAICLMGPAWRQNICAQAGIDISKCPPLQQTTTVTKTKEQKPFLIGAFYYAEKKEK